MSVTEFSANEVVSRANVNQRVSQINAYFPVSVANGGTGQTTLASGEILLGNGTSGVTSTSTLSVSKGGTGQTSLTSGEILLGNGTNGITSTDKLPIEKGGTGAGTAYDAAKNIGLTGTEKTITASTYAQFISQVQSDIDSAKVNKYYRVFGGRYYWSDHGESTVIAYYSSYSTAFIIFNEFAGIGTRLYHDKNNGLGWREAPLSIGSGGTGAATALAALQNLGIADVNESDFTASGSTDFEKHSSWLSQVFTYVDSNLEPRRPFVFNAGMANEGYGCGLAYQTLDTGFKFLILFNQTTYAGAKCYYKIPNGSWTEADSSGGVVLYNNSSGTSSTVALADSAANYGRLKIYYSNDDSQYFDLEIADPNGKDSILSSKRILNSNSTLYIKTCQISISGTSITFDSANYGMYRITTSGNSYNHEQKFKIHKVIGYKY